VAGVHRNLPETDKHDESSSKAAPAAPAPLPKEEQE